MQAIAMRINLTAFGNQFDMGSKGNERMESEVATIGQPTVCLKERMDV